MKLCFCVDLPEDLVEALEEARMMYPEYRSLQEFLMDIVRSRLRIEAENAKKLSSWARRVVAEAIS